MKSIFLSLALVLAVAAPAFADRSVDITGFVTWVDPNSEGTFDAPEDDIDVELGDEMGFGAAVNIFWGERISTELAVSQVDSPFVLTPRVRPINVSDAEVNMIPITAVLQFHFIPDGIIDPYIGAGAAYIVFGGDVRDEGNAGNLALDDIEGDDLGLVINGGVSFRLGSNFAIVGDVKYVPTSSAARAVLNNDEGTETDLEVSPIIVSAGLSLRF